MQLSNREIDALREAGGSIYGPEGYPTHFRAKSQIKLQEKGLLTDPFVAIRYGVKSEVRKLTEAGLAKYRELFGK